MFLIFACFICTLMSDLQVSIPDYPSTSLSCLSSPSTSLRNAVWDGTDAVMLSGEAATGKFPCEAVMAEASATREADVGGSAMGCWPSGRRRYFNHFQHISIKGAFLNCWCMYINANAHYEASCSILCAYEAGVRIKKLNILTLGHHRYAHYIYIDTYTYTYTITKEAHMLQDFFFLDLACFI